MTPENTIRREDVLDLLSRLVEKSLVIPERGAPPVFRFDENLRHYGLARLAEDPEPYRFRDQHARYYLAEAEEAAPHLRTGDQLLWLNRLDADRENHRAALHWFEADRDAAEESLRLCTALAYAWLVRGRFAEGLARFGAALRVPVGSPLGVRALTWGSWLAFWGSDYERSLRWASEAARYADGNELAMALAMVALCELLLGDEGAARVALGNLQASLSGITDPWVEACMLDGLGSVRMFEDRAVEAYPYLADACERLDAIGDRWFRGHVRIYLSRAHLLLGAPDEALVVLRESWVLFEELDGGVPLTWVAEGLAEVAEAEGRQLDAARLLGASAARRDDLGAPMIEESRFRAMLTRIGATIGAEALQAALESGRTISVRSALREQFDAD